MFVHETYTRRTPDVHEVYTPPPSHSPPLLEGGREPPTPSSGGAHPGGFAAGTEAEGGNRTAPPGPGLSEKVAALASWQAAGLRLLPETANLVAKFRAAEAAGKRRPVRKGEARILGRAYREHSKAEHPWLSKTASGSTGAPVVASEPEVRPPQPPPRELTPEELAAQIEEDRRRALGWASARARIAEATKRNAPAKPEEDDVTKRNAEALEQLRQEAVEGGGA